MKPTNFFQSKLTRSPADEGAPGGGEDSNPTPDPAGDPTPDPAPASEPAAPDFSWAGEEYVKDGEFDMDGFRGTFQDLLTEKTLRDERLANVPEDGNYEFAIPENLDLGDIKLPEGVDIKLDLENEAYKPVLGEFGAFLKEHNITQDEANQMIGFMAKYRAAETAQKIQQAEQSYEQLGPNDAAREARLSRVERALEVKLPGAQVAALKGALGSVDAVRAIENLLSGANGGKTVPTTPTNPSQSQVDKDLEAYYSTPTK